MHWYQNVDWAAVIAALVALFNAFQHKKTQAEVRANHAETLQALPPKETP